PDRDVLQGYAETGADDAGERLFALASRIPLGAADRYSVLAAPSAADRLVALDEAVVALAEMVEFQLSSRGPDE
ncbi:MAG TPA: ATP-dependent protease, partial [Mycobacterium sp.]